MSTVWAWVLQHPEIVAGFATVLLAAFAAVQLGLEAWRARQARESARIRARSWAWLARRNCEAAIHQGVKRESAYEWRSVVSNRKSLDEMQANMLQMLEVASLAQGSIASEAEKAFNEFLGFADRVNDVTPFRLSDKSLDGQGLPTPTLEERRRANQAVREAIEHLFGAVSALESIAPRQAHEPTLTDKATLPLATPPHDEHV